MKIVKAVAAVILKNNKIFCAQRNLEDEHGGKWEFPGGGIEKGEKPEEALIREIEEELNSFISVDLYLTTIEHDYSNFHLQMKVYLCSLLKGNLKLSEHMDSKWVTLEELETIDFADADKKIVSYLLKKDVGEKNDK